MARKSRDKGASGEREAAAIWRAGGYPEAQRSAQMQTALGDDRDADLRGTGLAWVEVKRHRVVPVGRLAVEVFAQERPGFEPVMAHRDDNREWMGTLPLPRLVAILRELDDWRSGAKMRPNLVLAPGGVEEECK